MPLDHLLNSIEKYFDCSLTDEQEEELRRQIATTTLSHPAIEEAKALMGFRNSESNISETPSSPRLYADNHSRRIDRHGFMAGASIAAAVALIISIGVIVLNPMKSATPQCVAYVNGQRVTDEDIVLALMAQNTHEFNIAADEAQQSLINELEFIAPVVDKYESDTNPLEI